MQVEECLLNLEEILEEGWNLPLTKGKAFVDLEKIRENIDEIRAVLPVELSQAKAIVADRTQIINDARSESDTIVKAAREKAQIIVSRDELVKQAESKAESIVNEAMTKSRDMKKAANDYVEDLMKRTEESLALSMSELRDARKDLRNTQR